MAVVWLVVVAFGQVGAARVARLRAQSAADLSALAAAARSLSATDPCGLARDVAIANQARLESCEMTGAVAEVSVSVRFRMLVPATGTAIATARAGPVEAPA